MQLFKVHEHFLLQSLSLSIPQQSPSLFITNNTCDILFRPKICQWLSQYKLLKKSSVSPMSPLSSTTPFLLAGQNSNEFWMEDSISKISSVDNYIRFLVLQYFGFPVFHIEDDAYSCGRLCRILH